MNKITRVTFLEPPKGYTLYQKVEIIENGKLTNTHWLWAKDQSTNKVKTRRGKGIKINIIETDTPKSGAYEEISS